MTAPTGAKKSRYDVVFLDFDGVVVDSNGIKNRAFEEIFERYPAQFDTLMAYHLSHNHVPRRTKFEYVAREILKIDEPEQWIDERVSEFTALTRRAVVECSYIGGAREFLERQSLLQPLVLVSATPLEELEIILHEREIRVFFHSVFGAPEKKAEIITRVLAEHGWAKDKSLFLGDSPEDLASAREAGVSFLGIVGNADFEGKGVPVAVDMRDAAEWIGTR